jgi:GntR family transcriptional regulator
MRPALCTVALNKQLAVPLYDQLKTILLEDIKTGRLAPNDRLPPEHAIAGQYAVSRATVRQALNELASAGFLRRLQGRGTFVADLRLEQGPRELTSFTDEMLKRGLRPTSKVLQRDVVKAEGVLAGKMKLKEGSDVFRLKRLRLAEGEAMGIQTAYVPSDLAPNLFEDDFERASLYEVFRRRYGLVPARALETHCATLLGTGEAELLEVAEGSPGLAVERLTFLNSERVLEAVYSVMRGDRYRITLELFNKG